MTARLQQWLEERWYHDAPVPGWLDLLSRVYARVAAGRRLRDLRHAQRLPVPVVVVGNLSVGGTGKTPVVIAVVEALREGGFHPGVISRGHGGREHGPARLGIAPDPARFGDEPVLIALRTGVPVVVGRDRPAAGRHLLDHHQQVDVIVSDDGLQHYRLDRDYEFCIVDGHRRHGNGQLLPAGPLREPLSRLRTVDQVLVNGDDGQGAVAFQLELAAALPLAGGEPRPLSAFCAEGPVHAVAGIGRPARFFAALRGAGLDVVEHPFKDHHRFRSSDLDFGDARPVLMTEKDAVKCKAFARPHWYAVPVSARLPDGVVDQLLVRLRAATAVGKD